ncbi:MAG: hypothetical protein WC956_01490 [bacterium]
MAADIRKVQPFESLVQDPGALKQLLDFAPASGSAGQSTNAAAKDEFVMSNSSGLNSLENKRSVAKSGDVLPPPSSPLSEFRKRFFA